MKRVKTKTKFPSVKTLKAKLWKVFSLFIRRREADDNGFTKCFTCGAKKHYKELDAGHYIPKSIGGANLYFAEKNIHPQCTYCNRYMHGNLSQYAIRLQAKYGPQILLWLEAQKKHSRQYNPSELTILINYYKKQNDQFGKQNRKAA